MRAPQRPKRRQKCVELLCTPPVNTVINVHSEHTTADRKINGKKKKEVCDADKSGCILKGPLKGVQARIAERVSVRAGESVFISGRARRRAAAICSLKKGERRAGGRRSPPTPSQSSVPDGSMDGLGLCSMKGPGGF